MKKILMGCAAAAWISLGLAACDNVTEFDDLGDGGTDTDTDTDTDADTDTDVDDSLTGVDLLVMIDNSGSMSQEQAMLATSLFSLVSALTSPLPDAAYSQVDDLRIAVITSNMGLSSNGDVNDQYWPGGDAPTGCHDRGDNGRFQPITATSVDLANDVIQCDATAAQCPEGWTCAGIDDFSGVGLCHTDGATAMACAAIPDVDWTETSAGNPNPDLALQASCLAQQGTEGCGWEQQLASVDTALRRSDQHEFLEDDHLLAILVVTDEDDCSMNDAEGLFSQPEVADQSQNTVNIACGEHPEYLHNTSYFYDTITSIKGPSHVVFAAVTGVPYQGDAADACQGPGDAIGACLDQAEMELITEQVDGGAWYYTPACTRTVDTVEVTKAYPARRFVELASEFGANSFVYSICNEDWSPAFAMVNAMIASKID
jgi:hypothetical protein